MSIGLAVCLIYQLLTLLVGSLKTPVTAFTNMV